MKRSCMMLKMELRNAVVPSAVCFAVLSAVWLLVPVYPVWMAVSFLLPFSGLVGKIVSCQMDRKDHNTDFLFSLPIKRWMFLTMRLLAGFLCTLCTYLGALALMHGVDRFSAQYVLDHADYAGWYTPEHNLFYQIATDRSGMFVVNGTTILHVVLAIFLLLLFVELYYVARYDCILPYGFCLILQIIFRFFHLSARKGDIMINFLVKSMPFIAELVYYGLCYVIIFLFLRKFLRGCDFEYEDYEATTGNSAT